MNAACGNKSRVVRFVVLIIGCVIFYALGAAVLVAVDKGKLKTQRKLPSYESRIDKPQTFFRDDPGRPMSQMAHISISDPIKRLLDEEHIIYTNMVTVGSLNGTSDTNMVKVYRRKWPVFGISDHIEKMTYNQIHIGTNIVHGSSLKGGIWTEADNLTEALLSNMGTICTNRVQADDKPASAGEV
jgi:hypothetical protein